MASSVKYYFLKLYKLAPVLFKDKIKKFIKKSLLKNLQKKININNKKS